MIGISPRGQAQPTELQRLAAKLDVLEKRIVTLTAVIEGLTGQMVGLNLELQAARERWEAGGGDDER